MPVAMYILVQIYMIPIAFFFHINMIQIIIIFFYMMLMWKCICLIPLGHSPPAGGKPRRNHSKIGGEDKTSQTDRRIP